MDIKAIIAPAIQDREALEEFADALQDKAVEIERYVAQLKITPGNRDIIDDLFRAVHNIKGDAALTKVELGVTITHGVESLLSRFREGHIQFSDRLAETILLTLDRLELAIEGLLKHKPLDSLRLVPLVQGLEKTAQALPDQIDDLCAELIEIVTGFPPVVTAPSTVMQDKPAITPIADHVIAADLQFFRSLAMQLENRSPFFKGRTTRILRLALEANKAAEHVVDPVQLEAAIYMHDVGMMFLPESVWLKVGQMSAEEKLTLRTHPNYAATLLQRMPGWEGAAEIVAQHHEMPDGSGYPNNLKDEQICAGAKVIAIVDAFEAVMLKHSHHGKNRSVLRAIAEINACDNQFAPEWTLPFNTVIRRTIETTS
ncbi:MAG: HD domain-containing protein [Zoogloeaceae bacterium]|jgi:HD-GYP domain-containing protein (c-di-GMP phosphodiesterase class II)|nr:HD domain-containing protein [Zoogloeaceae bacterium]